jgi:hypothetical protein
MSVWHAVLGIAKQRWMRYQTSRTGQPAAAAAAALLLLASLKFAAAAQPVQP